VFAIIIFQYTNRRNVLSAVYFAKVAILLVTHSFSVKPVKKVTFYCLIVIILPACKIVL
jgi:hypothetical protein